MADADNVVTDSSIVYLKTYRLNYVQDVQDTSLSLLTNPCGGGVEYLHREPASRKRRRNGTKKGRAIA
jgi:hypothetical protein